MSKITRDNNVVLENFWLTNVLLKTKPPNQFLFKDKLQVPAYNSYFQLYNTQPQVKFKCQIK